MADMVNLAKERPAGSSSTSGRTCPMAAGPEHIVLLETVKLAILQGWQQV